MGLDHLGAGLIGQAMGAVLTVSTWGASRSAPGEIGFAMLVMGTGVVLGGCGMFVRYHRLRRWWGLLGFFSIAGVAILLMVPLMSPVERRKRSRQGFEVIFAEPYRRDVWRMDVRVTLDQSVGAAVREPIVLQLPRGANVGTAIKTLAGVIPELDTTQSPSERFAINGQPADRRAELSDGDELAVSATIAETAHG
jgi:hypothetical protein